MASGKWWVVRLGMAAMALAIAASLLFTWPHGAQAQGSDGSFKELRAQASELSNAGRDAEAEEPARAALSAAEQLFAEGDSRTLESIDQLAALLSRLDKPSEAEPLYRRALAIREQGDGENQAAVAVTLNDLALVLEELRQYGEAKALYVRAVAAGERGWSANDPNVATILGNLAWLLDGMGDFDEAERHYRRALAIYETAADVERGAKILNNLAILLEHASRLEEAATLHRRVIAISASIYPPDHPHTTESLSNLATVLYHLKRFEEAAALNRRVLETRERTLRPDDLDIADSLNNLAMVITDEAEAERLLRRALEIRERVLQPNDPDIATSLNNLALQIDDKERLGEVEELYRRALDIRRVALPPDHPRIAQSLTNLASTLDDLDRDDEAKTLHLQALAMYEKTLPPNHPEIATSLMHLAWINAEQEAYREALSLRERANLIRTAPENRGTIASHEWRYQAELRLRDAAALQKQQGDGVAVVVRDARQAAFADLQQGRSGGTGGAVAAAAARAQAANPVLSRLARERDSALAEMKRLDAEFLGVSSDQLLSHEARAARLADLRDQFETAGRKLERIVAELAIRFPTYVDLAESPPAQLEELQPLLGPDEAFVFITPYSDAGFLFALTRERDIFVPLPNTDDAAQLARRMRCSAAGRLDPSCRAAEGHITVAASDMSRGAVPMQSDSEDSGLFDMALAHDLYNRLFPDEARHFLIGKRLIVVPAPELMGVPWHLLLTQPPPAGWDADGADRAALYRDAAWLFQSHPAITILPNASSLRALRGVIKEQDEVRLDYLGIGDPVIGRDDAERDAPPMECGSGEPIVVAVADRTGRAVVSAPADVFAGANDGGFAMADPDLIRRQPRLADTRCEIERVSAALGGGNKADVLLGADASESRIKALDESGELERYRILHFATHGLVGGELGLGEPGLLLTPPAIASARDDGVMTVSEIATLTLNVDWVVLSACNTAAGSEAGAEALSGLAKAFFYAGARSLLVSSWPVYSSAAVKITTAGFAAMAADPQLGRAEALVIAMRRTLAASRDEHTAHPQYWAPFFLVGEGASPVMFARQ